jgi:plasmid stability protein
MGEIRVRDVDDAVVQAFKDMARRHGRSVAAEAREVLTEAVHRQRRQLIDRLDALRADIQAEAGILPDSTAMIREERDRL